VSLVSAITSTASPMRTLVGEDAQCRDVVTILRSRVWGRGAKEETSQ